MNRLKKERGKLNRQMTQPVILIVSLLINVFLCFLVDNLHLSQPFLWLAVIMALQALNNRSAGIGSLISIVSYYVLVYRSDSWDILLPIVVLYVCAAFYKRRLERENDILRHTSDHDELTGLYNRRGGDARVARILEDDPDHPAVMAALDIDDFKDINDSYGHDAGDAALRCFADSLKARFRDHAVLIRNGGDEFQAFIDASHFKDVGELLNDLCQHPLSFDYHHQQIAFTVSCGYIVYPTQAVLQKELYRKADAALYYAKINGKHYACLYSGDFDNDSTQLQFSARSIAENLPIAFMVYRADESEKILVVSRTLLAMIGCSDFDSFMQYTGGTFRGFVHPDDVDEVETNIADQMQNNRFKLDVVDYRIIRTDGQIVNIHDLGRLVHDQRWGDLFYVALYNKNLLTVDVHSHEK